MEIAAPIPIETLVRDLAGKPITAFRDMIGAYRYDEFTLFIDFIGDDMKAPNARMRVRVPLSRTKIPKDVFAPRSREIAARDFMARACSNAAIAAGKRLGRRGGRVSVETGGREIVESSAVVVGDDTVEVRFSADLPAGGAVIHPERASVLFMQLIPSMVKDGLLYENLNGDALVSWLEIADDADHLRGLLPELGLVAFVADGSRPVRPGDTGTFAPFIAPEELEVRVEVPNKGTIRGMGIPRGITVIAGGYGCGKSTLLASLAQGVYNHVPDDGRARMVAVPDTMALVTDTGRRIEGVDLSAVFPGGLPGAKPGGYRTDVAAPAAAFAADFMEMLELGATVFLIDEDDTPAALFAGDPVMRDFLGNGSAPVPMSVLAPALRDALGVSFVVAASAGGDWLAAADTVITLEKYRPVVVTGRARETVSRHGLALPEPPKRPVTGRRRIPLPHTLVPPKGRGEYVRPPGWKQVQYGDSFIDCSRLPQLANRAQVRGISRGIALAARLADGSKSVGDLAAMVVERVMTVGLDTLSNRLMGDLAAFRTFELAAVINRLKAVKMKER